MTNALTDQDFWKSFWGQRTNLSYNPLSILFKDIFEEYVYPGSSCFEVGCYPGRYMVFLAKKFDCSVSGIDFVPQFENLERFLLSENVIPDHLYNEDFLTFEPVQTFDFVYSLGFVEHFVNFQEVITKHIQLVSEGGILFIECPNFRGPVQHFLHRVFDKQNLQEHYLPAMDLTLWRKLLGLNHMEILYDGYYRTFDFWTDHRQSHSHLSRYIIRYIKRIGKKIDQVTDRPNFWTSPYLVSISRKKTGN